MSTRVPKKIIITGGSGLIGNALTKAFVSRGDQVWILSRHPEEVHLPEGAKAVRWDGKTAQGWGSLVAGADVIINLAGANIGARPWTNVRKQLIRSSRVDAGRAIVEAVQQNPHTGDQLSVLQIAGVGYYGDQGDQPLDEQSPAGQDFLASVAADWENASKPVAGLGARHIILRTGVVLSPKGGILAPILLQNQLFMGGPLGSGRQWISWIHLQDLVRVIDFVLTREDIEGVLNAVAPEPLTNADFGRTVSEKMHRPFWIPAPAFMLRAVLGEMSTLILEGQRVLPRRLMELGFQFEFPTLQEALDDLLKQK